METESGWVSRSNCRPKLAGTDAPPVAAASRWIALYLPLGTSDRLAGAGDDVRQALADSWGTGMRRHGSRPRPRRSGPCSSRRDIGAGRACPGAKGLPSTSAVPSGGRTSAGRVAPCPSNPPVLETSPRRDADGVERFGQVYRDDRCALAADIDQYLQRVITARDGQRGLPGAVADAHVPDQGIAARRLRCAEGRRRSSPSVAPGGRSLVSDPTGPPSHSISVPSR